GYNYTTRTPTPWIPLGSIDFKFETAGKRKHRTAHAEHLVEAARFKIPELAWGVRGTLQTALIDLVAAQTREKLIERHLAVAQQILALLEEQRKAGAVAPSAVIP